MNHPSTQRLYEYADRTIANGQLNEIELHVRTCDECRSVVNSIRRLDAVARRVPVETTSDDFTERVMARIGVRQSSPLGWSLLANLAPILALIVVVGIVYVVLQASGTFEGSSVGQSISATKTVYDSVGKGISYGVDGFNAWLKPIVPFLYMKTSYGIIAFTAILFGLVAVLDKYIFVPFYRRRI